MTTLAAIVLIAIAFVALIGYYEFRISRINTELANSNSVVWQWVDYAEAIESDLDAATTELNRISREYGKAITNWKVKHNHIPSVRVAYTDKTKHGDPITRVNTQLGLFPTDNMFSDGEFKPQYDENGIIVFERVIVPDVPAIATNGNGHKSTDDSSKIESTDNASDSSKRDSGSFTASDDSALLKSAKYGELLDLLLADLKAKKIPSAKYDYVKSKFLGWEKSKNPSDAKEYAKRIINAKYGGK